MLNIFHRDNSVSLKCMHSNASINKKSSFVTSSTKSLRTCLRSPSVIMIKFLLLINLL